MTFIRGRMSATEALRGNRQTAKMLITRDLLGDGD
jgi:hypothetical protein